MIVEKLSLFQTIEEQTVTGTSTTVGGKASADANFLVVKGTGEVNAALENARSTGRRGSRTVSSRVAALAGLKSSGLPLVIDDFHYLSRELQAQIVRALKPLVFDGLPVVVIAIPHRRYDAVKVEREMSGRVTSIEIPAWTNDELCFIPETGFNALGWTIDSPNSHLLAAQAIGSPHLMQDFCRGISRARTLEASSSAQTLSIDHSQIDFVFRDVADTIGRPIFEKLARGPRQRTDRIPRQLKDGREVDIYELVLHALASLRPGLVSPEYEDLRGAIRDVSASQIPQLQEVARVLKHMATIAASDQSSTPVIDFEEDDKNLHITDPFFAFYLRWGDLTS